MGAKWNKPGSPAYHQSKANVAQHLRKAGAEGVEPKLDDGKANHKHSNVGCQTAHGWLRWACVIRDVQRRMLRREEF
jgi:hypothetical protein